LLPLVLPNPNEHQRLLAVQPVKRAAPAGQVQVSIFFAMAYGWTLKKTVSAPALMTPEMRLTVLSKRYGYVSSQLKGGAFPEYDN
jgi:hypothetical protein